MSAYRTTEVAEVLGLTPRQVRYYIYAGLLSPDRGSKREYRYSFRDLVLLRLGRRLAGAHIPVPRISRALKAIQETLAPDEPLASIEVDALGEVVIARDRDGVWDPESGQRYFEFALPAPGEKPGPPETSDDTPVLSLEDWRPAAPEPGPLLGDPSTPPRLKGERQTAEEAAEWFERALELEDVDTDRAKAAYKRVLLLVPTSGDAHANLGRLLYEEGQLAQAAQHFGQAFQLDPSNATAAYNLAVSFEDLDNPEAALEAYRRSIEADPRLSAAHYNLSRLYEARGESAAALRHLSEYRRLETDR